MSKTARILPLILSFALMIPALSACSGKSGSQTDASSGEGRTDQPSGTESAPSDPSTAPEQTGITLAYGDCYAVSDAASVADPSVAEISGGVLRAKSVGQTEIIDGDSRTPLTVNPAVVDVVLFTGQSNMVGRETARYSVEIPEGQAYEYKHLTGSLTDVKNPVGETFGEVEVSSGSSIVPKFCADYVAAERKIVAVHVARGGRSISYFDSRNGLIYRDILEKYGGCIEYLENNPNFTVGRRFYVIYQGETDTNNGMSADSYKSRFSRFHNGMKSNLGIEFGALISSGRNSDPVAHDGIRMIQRVKEELAAEQDDVILADVSAYNWYIRGEQAYIRSDLIHLNAEGLQIVAAESCKNILNYLGLGSDPSLAGVDPATYLAVAEEKPADEPEDRSWTFDDGKIDGAERVGTVTPKIEDGRYVNDQNSHVRYRLEKTVTLPANRNYEIEWSGKAYKNMSNNASILLSCGAEMFLTFQGERGVYLRCGENRFDVSSAISVNEIYKDHVWKLSYSAEKHQVAVYLDGTLIKTGSWSSDLTFTDLLGCTNNLYTFVGELDYLKITVE